MASPLRKRKRGKVGVRRSLWQHRNAAKGAERGSTSVVAGARVDVVLEPKRQRCGSTVGGHRPLRRRTEQRTRVKCAITGRRVMVVEPIVILVRLPLVACGQVMASPVRTWPTAASF